MGLEAGELAALMSVIVVDLALAGDNAIVVGMAAAGLPREQQRRVVALGVGIAVVCRILFSVIAVQLLTIIGLLFAGGLLLLWVAWKMWLEVRAEAAVLQRDAVEVEGGHAAGQPPPKTFSMAVLQIAIADISMSLDNVLAVAGTARHHTWVLVVGLALSVILMGVAASYVAQLMNRYPWLTYLGLVIIVFVALSMIYEGGLEIVAAWNGA
jgi:YjbE family integral membrane protein